jgi:phenylalanine-4-hydroxylase
MSAPLAEGSENRVSLLIQLDDRPGALAGALAIFSVNNVNLTHIESRPSSGDNFDFYVDCEGQRGDPGIEACIKALAGNMLILDDREVPWFPRHVSELDRIAANTLDAGTDLASDHPGFSDPKYRERRAHIDALARQHHFGASIPVVEYNEDEVATWREVFNRLKPLHEAYACPEYKRAIRAMSAACGFSPDSIPQGRDIDRFLASRTGFHIWPVAGLLSSRDFLNGLAFRVFFSTQYIRHHSMPLYTPEPDVCHELIGHAPMFADAAFADLSQEIGLASLGASDADIQRLARCYWHSVEFGLVGSGEDRRAYGAGLLSSFGELEYACGNAPDEGEPEYRNWDPDIAAETDFPITEYQPTYFVARDLQDAKASMSRYCRNLARPFYARFNPATRRIWVDRAVHRT